MRFRTLALAAATAACLAVSGATLAQSQPRPASPPPPQPAAGGPSWNSLTPQQREALAPLAGQWSTMPADRKRRWIEIAQKYPQLSPESKAHLQSRMPEFAGMTPQQRQTARENFQRAYELPPESRESAVQQYKALPDDKKKALSERSKAADPSRPDRKK
jgi:hypothetical protein